MEDKFIEIFNTNIYRYDGGNLRVLITVFCTHRETDIELPGFMEGKTKGLLFDQFKLILN